MPPITINIPTLTLNGWKTYVCAVALIGLSVAHSLGYISNNLYDIMLPIVGGGGLAALRAGIKKSDPEPLVSSLDMAMANIAGLVTEVAKVLPKTDAINSKDNPMDPTIAKG